MTKLVNCRDVGFDCGHVVRSATEEEALEQVVVHVKAVHNVETVLKEVIEEAREEMQMSRQDNVCHWRPSCVYTKVCCTTSG